jgi:hypothetical protein
MEVLLPQSYGGGPSSSSSSSFSSSEPVLKKIFHSRFSHNKRCALKIAHLVKPNQSPISDPFLKRQGRWRSLAVLSSSSLVDLSSNSLPASEDGSVPPFLRLFMFSEKYSACRSSHDCRGAFHLLAFPFSVFFFTAKIFSKIVLFLL